MARYKSATEITGSLGDLVYYQLDGIPVVRRKSGFNRKSFEEKESYQKVRENSSEFGHCSKSGKMLREALEEYIPYAKDKYFYRKVARLMTEIKDLDLISPRGKRTVPIGLQSSEVKTLLRSFAFGEIPLLDSKIELSEDLFEKTLLLPKKTKAHHFALLTLELDFSSYTFTMEKREFPLGEKSTIILEDDSSSSKSSSLLYFGVLFKEEEIVEMGFL